MQKLNKVLAAFLAILIAISIFPLPTNIVASLESSVTFVPVSPYNEFDVRVNGTGDIITIYCLQQKYRWPKDEEHVIYYDKDDANSEFSYKNLLSDEEVEILRKLVYAGYPNDSQGILRKYYLEGEWGAEFTNQAIWSLMAEWEKPGSDPTSKLDYDNIDESDFAAIVAAELINYQRQLLTSSRQCPLTFLSKVISL